MFDLRKANADLAQEVQDLTEQLAAAAAVATIAGSNTQTVEGAATADAAATLAPQRTAAAPKNNKYALEPFDLGRFLGQTGIVSGFLFKPHTCLPPWSKTVEDSALVGAAKAKLLAHLVRTLRTLSVNATAANDEELFLAAPIREAMGIRDVDDPLFAEVDRQLSSVMAMYLLSSAGGRQCVCGKPSGGPPVTSVDQLGSHGCPDGAAVPEDLAAECVGHLSHILSGEQWGLRQLVDQTAERGLCTSAVYEPNYAAWWIKNRLLSPEYQNFNVADKQEDTVLELFDLMYESKSVFLRQKWMGVSMMQDPFDLLAIQNLIYELKPDIIIETGTANGGSALLWASVLEVLGLESTRIHTIDMNDPTVGFGSHTGSADPTKHRLWSKYVVFHKGFSTDEKVINEVKAAVDEASAANKNATVMALLDSDHWIATVSAELKTYCNGLVTVGSYCVVEDTKLSRMSHMPAPLEAVREFLGNNTGAAGQQRWVADRDRELMYSQHVMGYLKRLA